MRSTILLTALVLASGASFAAEGGKPSDARAAQTARMKGCSADARAQSLKGDERKAFMSACLKKKS